jgi:zinc protease
LAQQIFAGDSTSEIGGEFQINALARPGKSLDEIEQEINKVIEAVKTEGVTQDEVNRAINVREAQAIYGLQTDLGKAESVAYFSAYLNNPHYFQQDLDRYLKVTPDDVKRVANKYLVANHLVMSYVPSKTRPAAAASATPTSTEKKKKDVALIAKQTAMLPKGGPDPKFSLPAVDKSKLSNGLNVWVVQQHELPIVSMNLVLNAGGERDASDHPGAASITASMLTQGTDKYSAVQLANETQAIGSQINAGAGWDTSNVTMTTLTKNFDKALDIFADVVMHPSFPENEFQSLKRRAMANFLQRKSNATAVAGVVYDKVLYGDQAYGRQLIGDEKSVKAMGRGDLENFYQANYVPNNATLIVVGDVSPADVRARLEKAFASWKPGDVKPFTLSPQTMAAKPAIYLVDMPGAAQSSVNIGLAGLDRNNPDYYAVQVMNSILGGGASGRLFMNIREDKGYTYGAYSRFTYRRGAGPFTAYGEIQTGSTKEAVQEFLNEINGIRGRRPVSQAELEANKQALIRRFPSAFETVGGISGQLGTLVTYGLPDNYFNDYISKINAVTLDDVNRVANKYLDPSKMAIVIVGDRKVIEPGLVQLGLPLTHLDAEGNPVTQ